MEFIDGSINPAAEQVFQLVKAGFLRACSVGFCPLDPPMVNAKGGNDYGRVELLEVSLVPVPAQPAALAKALRRLSHVVVRRCPDGARPGFGLIVAGEEGEASQREFLGPLPDHEQQIVADLVAAGEI